MNHRMERILSTGWCKSLLAIALAVGCSLPVLADGGVTYHNIAAGDHAGITYRRAPSPRIANKEYITANAPWPVSQFFQLRNDMSPQKGTGSPGVAIFDYDGDGDLDIYVTNGPGKANSLYSNQLAETGQLTFVDVAQQAGVAATDQDSSGVCFGDIDNDGDEDLYVTGTGDDPPNALYGPTGTTNRLFRNNGDGTFTDITASAGVDNYGRHAIGCSFADIDNDGYLDVVVGNSYNDWGQRRPTFVNAEDPGLEYNVLYHNNGDDTFTDVSVPAGLHNVSNMTAAAFTWAIAMVDVDGDGDPDILSADNQGGASTQPSEERGWLRLYKNDGHGNFTEVTQQVGLDKEGGWMGLSFGDLNCDGYTDFFASNLGSYARSTAASRWFLNSASGQWTDPGLGPDIVADPFGWGTSMLDYDNDGDLDIHYEGGVDLLASALADNPGVIFQNTGDCSGHFVWDSSAMTTDNRLRSVNGEAVGDLNGDGFMDIVDASNFNIVPFNYFPLTVITGTRGGPFDSVVRVELEFYQLIPGEMVWLQPTYPPGDLAVEINSADNGNNWVELKMLGGKGVIPQGTVNRDGIGALVSFTPEGAATVMKPVVGGSSYASQDALMSHFGLGQATEGDAKVLWPGGIKNRLYDVHAGEKLTVPEIPCSYDAHWGNFGQYNSCVMRALNAYKHAGVLSSHQVQRFRDSARRAYDEANGCDHSGHGNGGSHH